MEALFFLLVIGAFIYYLANNKKKNNVKNYPIDWSDMEDRNIRRDMDIISESLKIVQKSKNLDTKLSRVGVAITIAEKLVTNYPHREDVASCLEGLRKAKCELYTECYIDKTKRYVNQANVSNIHKTKVSNATKALAIIEEGLHDDDAHKERLEDVKQKIISYIHAVEKDDLEKKAEKHAFKGEYGKAASAYLDTIYYLHNDHIDDSQQQKDIEALYEKVEAMRSAAAEGNRHKRRLQDGGKDKLMQ